MNRRQRRRVEAMGRRATESDLAVCADRASLIRLVAVLAEIDPTISGATLITPDGDTSFVDATLLRQGGNA